MECVCVRGFDNGHGGLVVSAVASHLQVVVWCASNGVRCTSGGGMARVRRQYGVYPMASGAHYMLCCVSGRDVTIPEI